jgi:hypothetical protein
LSVCSFTQLVPHTEGVPDGHWHVPEAQLWAARQALPHVPQLFESLASVAQVPVQFACPLWHPVPQAYVDDAPAWHTGVAPLHEVVQVPQVVAAARLVAHPVPVLAQSPKPAAHWYEQWPPEHESPDDDTCPRLAHAAPHAPQ